MLAMVFPSTRAASTCEGATIQCYGSERVELSTGIGDDASRADCNSLRR